MKVMAIAKTGASNQRAWPTLLSISFLPQTCSGQRPRAVAVPSGALGKTIAFCDQTLVRRPARPKSGHGTFALAFGSVGGAQRQSEEWTSITMLNRDTARSQALGMRVADLKAKMQDAQITEGEMKAFQKVATIMENRQGRIDGDDLIAASFVTDTLLNSQSPE